MAVDLEEALSALEKGDRTYALERLLASWRATRSQAIADVIDLASDTPSQSLGETLSIDERHERWLELCRVGSSMDMPLLLAELIRPGDAAAYVLPRLRELERHHPLDPRAAPKLLDLLLGGLPWKRSPIWTVVFRWLTRLADGRGCTRLAAIAPPLDASARTVVDRIVVLLANAHEGSSFWQ